MFEVETDALGVRASFGWQAKYALVGTVVQAQLVQDVALALDELAASAFAGQQLNDHQCGVRGLSRA